MPKESFPFQLVDIEKTKEELLNEKILQVASKELGVQDLGPEKVIVTTGAHVLNYGRNLINFCSKKDQVVRKEEAVRSTKEDTIFLITIISLLIAIIVAFVQDMRVKGNIIQNSLVIVLISFLLKDYIDLLKKMWSLSTKTRALKGD